MLILFFSNVTITIYANSDITILDIYKDDFSVGIYGVSVKIYTIIKQLISAVFIVVIPRLSFYIANNYDKYKSLLVKLKNGIFIFSIPIITGSVMLSEEIILILSGKEYILASSSFKILSFALIFSAFATMYGNGILLLKMKEKYLFISTLVGALVNIILNIIFIPLFSYNAAAATTVFSEFIVFLLNYMFSKGELKKFDMKIDLGLLLRIIIGNILIIIICLTMKKIFSNYIVLISACLIFSTRRKITRI